MKNEYLAEYYRNYREDDRLSASNHGRVEYLTTMEYIHRYLEKECEFWKQEPVRAYILWL